MRQRAAEVIMRQATKLRGQIGRVKHAVQRVQRLVVLRVLKGADAELKEVGWVRRVVPNDLFHQLVGPRGVILHLVSGLRFDEQPLRRSFSRIVPLKRIATYNGAVEYWRFAAGKRSCQRQLHKVGMQ